MSASHLLMIRPSAFMYNAQTAVNNAFQQQGKDSDINQKAQTEFDDFVKKLQEHKIEVTIIPDIPEPHTPDAIFPNNWFSFHEKTLVLYPMFAENRRTERKKYADQVKAANIPERIIDYSWHEADGRFLEGTGSMVLDRENKIAYACMSPRTDLTIFEDFCRQMNYEPIAFHAIDGNGQPVYHTNVMMCMGDAFVVICTDSIKDSAEREMLSTAFIATKKKIIPISISQMNHFAGNMLQVENAGGEKFLVMSEQAYQSLSREQLTTLSSFNTIIHSPLDTIEKNGGGSARCMMAEMG